MNGEVSIVAADIDHTLVACDLTQISSVETSALVSTFSVQSKFNQWLDTASKECEQSTH